jgi:type IV pilus assembly protein PilB
MGIAPFNDASSVTLITAAVGTQVVQLKATYRPPEVLRAGFNEESLDVMATVCSRGCELCKEQRLWGRLGIFEVLAISEEMTRILMKNGSALDIAAQARAEGFRNLRQSGLVKVKQGITSLEEIEAVTNQ